MKYFNTYTGFSEDVSSIDLIIEENDYNIIKILDILDEGRLKSFLIRAKNKIGDWTVKAPKVRKLQEKANAEYIKAIQARVKFRKDTEVIATEATTKAKKLDHDFLRIKTVMEKKVAIHIKMAHAHEKMANSIIDDNPYLQKVKRITRYKGKIAENNMLLDKALEEEEFELNADNAKIRDQVEIDTEDLNLAPTAEPGVKDDDSSATSRDLGNDIMTKVRNKPEFKEGGLDEDEEDKVKKYTGLWIRHLTNELFAAREGNQPRASQNIVYRMIDDAVRLQEEKKIGPGAALEKIIKDYKRKGLYNPKNTKHHIFKRDDGKK